MMRVVNEPCPGCVAERRRADAIEIDLQNAQTELLAKLRRIGQLQKEMRELREEEPESQQIKTVCDYWIEKASPRSKCPPGGKRWEKVRARLKEKFTVERLILAVDGARAFPYDSYGERYRENVKGTKRRTDLLYICRDETTVERLERLGLEHRMGTPAAPELLADAYLLIREELDEAGVPGASTLARVRHLTEEWMKAPEKPHLRVVA